VEELAACHAAPKVSAHINALPVEAADNNGNLVAMNGAKRLGYLTGAWAARSNCGGLKLADGVPCRR
jgi:hypothetical protein